jgi:hypothetical protein
MLQPSSLVAIPNLAFSHGEDQLSQLATLIFGFHPRNFREDSRKSAVIVYPNLGFRAGGGYFCRT